MLGNGVEGVYIYFHNLRIILNRSDSGISCKKFDFVFMEKPMEVF